jgi:hypothetical protein
MRLRNPDMRQKTLILKILFNRREQWGVESNKEFFEAARKKFLQEDGVNYTGIKAMVSRAIDEFKAELETSETGKEHTPEELEYRIALTEWIQVLEEHKAKKLNDKETARKIREDEARSEIELRKLFKSYGERDDSESPFSEWDESSQASNQQGRVSTNRTSSVMDLTGLDNQPADLPEVVERQQPRKRKQKRKRQKSLNTEEDERLARFDKIIELEEKRLELKARSVMESDKAETSSQLHALEAAQEAQRVRLEALEGTVNDVSLKTSRIMDILLELRDGKR